MLELQTYRALERLDSFALSSNSNERAAFQYDCVAAVRVDTERALCRIQRTVVAIQIDIGMGQLVPRSNLFRLNFELLAKCCCGAPRAPVSAAHMPISACAFAFQGSAAT